MQSLPYLKLDNQKANLIIRSLADKPLHHQCPLAARVSAPLKKKTLYAVREPSRGSGWKEGRKGRAEERKETVGSRGKPGPRGTLPVSAVHTSFPALPAQRAGRLQPGPRERGQGPGPGTGASTASQPRVSARQPPGVCPAAPDLQPEGRGKVSSAGGLRGRGTLVAGRRGRFPSRDEGRVAWGKPTGPGWCCPRPAPPTSPPERGQAALGSSERNANRLYLGSPSKRGLWFLWDEVVPTLRWKVSD